MNVFVPLLFVLLLPCRLRTEDLPLAVNRFITGDDQALSALSQHPEETLELLRGGWTHPVYDENAIPELLEQLGAARHPERTAATDRLIAMGGGVIPHVREHMQAHRDDPEVLMRCRLILETVQPVEWADWTHPDHAPRIFEFLLSRESWTAEDLNGFEHHYLDILSHPGDRDRLNKLRSLRPDALRNFIRHSLRHEAFSDKLSEWARRANNAAVTRELGTQKLAMVFEEFPEVDTEAADGIPGLVGKALRPAIAEKLRTEQWRVLADVIASSRESSADFLEVFEKHQPLPDAFRDQSERIFSARSRRHQLLGAWMSKDDVWAAHRPALATLIREKVPPREWVAHIELNELSREETWAWLRLRALTTIDLHEPTANRLAERLEGQSDREVLEELARDTERTPLLWFFRHIRPELRSGIQLMLCDELEQDFSIARLTRFGSILGNEFHIICTPGAFDADWQALLEDESHHPVLFRNAPGLSISPELLWASMREYPQWLEPDRQMIFQTLIRYILEYGEADAAREVLEHLMQYFETPDTDPGTLRPFERTMFEMDHKKHPDLLDAHVWLLNQLIRVERGPNLLNLILSNPLQNSRYPLPGDYPGVYMEEIRRSVRDPEQAAELLPVICILALNDDLLEAHRDLWKEGIRNGLGKADPDLHTRFARAITSIRLGLEYEGLLDDFTGILTGPDTDFSLNRFLYLLDSGFERALPRLLEAARESPPPNRALQAALFIAPDDPGVLAVIHREVLQGESLRTAGALLHNLYLFDLAPPLSAYSPERVEAFFQPESDEDVTGLIYFLRTLSPGEREMVTDLFIDSLPEIADHFNSRHNFASFINDHPQKYQRILPAFLELLQSEESPRYACAVRQLWLFSEFAPDQIQMLWEAYERFQGHRNRMNLHPNILIAISNAGERAAPLVPKVREAAERAYLERHGHLRALPWRTLANISSEPEIKTEALQALLDLKNDSSFVAQSEAVRQLGYLQDMDDVVFAVMRRVLSEYLHQGPQGNIRVRTAREAVWALARVRPEDQLLRNYIEILAMMEEGNNASRLVEQVLWSLRTALPERLHEAAEAIEALPARLRASRSWRMTHEMLNRSP